MGSKHKDSPKCGYQVLGDIIGLVRRLAVAGALLMLLLLIPQGLDPANPLQELGLVD